MNNFKIISIGVLTFLTIFGSLYLGVHLCLELDNEPHMEVPILIQSNVDSLNIIY